MTWKSACCAVQGTGHKKHHVPCQDKTFEIDQDGIHVIALADGAGSASLSHFGAGRVVRDVAGYLANHFHECFKCEDGRKVKQFIVELIQESLADEAKTHGCSLRDLSSTLLVAAVDDERYILIHIGDGVIGYLDNDKLKVASTPDNGEFSNETVFVTSGQAASAMRLFKGELKNKDGFVLMSDGTERSFYHKQSKTLGNIVLKLMHRTRLLDSTIMASQLQESFESVITKNTQDDCSIALLVRPSEFLSPVEALDFKARQDLYGIREGDRRERKRVARCDALLATVATPSTLAYIAQHIHLRPRYTRKHLNRLISLGLLKKQGDMYCRA